MSGFIRVELLPLLITHVAEMFGYMLVEVSLIVLSVDIGRVYVDGEAYSSSFDDIISVGVLLNPVVVFSNPFKHLFFDVFKGVECV